MKKIRTCFGEGKAMTENPNRRRFMKKSLGISTGIIAGLSFEHEALLAQLVKRSNYGKVQEPVKGLICQEIFS